MTALPGRRLRLPSQSLRLAFFAALSVLLMMGDHRGYYPPALRAGLSGLVYPLQLAAAVPVRVGGRFMEWTRRDDQRFADLERLRADQQLQEARLQRLEAIEAENAHLRELLGAAKRLADRAAVAELLEVSAEPFTRKLVLSKGADDGLYLGQPIVDARGIMGQITAVNRTTSRATLITDPGHAIPVMNQRNGLRAIVFGTGAQDEVAVRHLTALADIQEGDLLVSSGLGGAFPPGYPVARVSRIANDPNESFLDIRARPVAALGHNKDVLLIWPGPVARR
jgi:rod shape-determining protein MreC